MCFTVRASFCDFSVVIKIVFSCKHNSAVIVQLEQDEVWVNLRSKDTLLYILMF